VYLIVEPRESVVQNKHQFAIIRANPLQQQQHLVNRADGNARWHANRPARGCRLCGHQRAPARVRRVQTHAYTHLVMGLLAVQHIDNGLLRHSSRRVLSAEIYRQLYRLLVQHLDPPAHDCAVAHGHSVHLRICHLHTHRLAAVIRSDAGKRHTPEREAAAAPAGVSTLTCIVAVSICCGIGGWGGGLLGAALPRGAATPGRTGMKTAGCAVCSAMHDDLRL
jgi:hypothetical protein